MLTTNIFVIYGCHLRYLRLPNEPLDDALPPEEWLREGELTVPLLRLGPNEPPRLLPNDDELPRLLPNDDEPPRLLPNDDDEGWL